MSVCNYHPAVHDLWDEGRDRNRATARPLAHRLRPSSLEEVLGQDHLLGDGAILRRMVDAGVVGSLILHGPPGTGKTTTLVELLLHAVCFSSPQNSLVKTQTSPTLRRFGDEDTETFRD